MNEIKGTNFPRNIKKLRNYYEDNSPNCSDENADVLTVTSTALLHNYEGVHVKSMIHHFPQNTNRVSLDY